MATCGSFSVINRNRRFPFMTARAENPVSHNYVITEGSKISVALSDKL
jgi:hypothetical protein